MTNDASPSPPRKRLAPHDKRPSPLTWRVRAALMALFLLAVATVWITNALLTSRFTETTRNRAELRLALYSGNLLSELRRNAIVPQLLSRDPALITALNSMEYSQSSQRLISYVDEIGAASLMLLDDDGRTVAATDRNRLGESHRNAPYFVDALRSNSTVFTTMQREFGGYSFTYSRRLRKPGQRDRRDRRRGRSGQVRTCLGGHFGCGAGYQFRGQHHPRHRTALARPDARSGTSARTARQRHRTRDPGYRQVDGASGRRLRAGRGGDAHRWAHSVPGLVDDEFHDLFFGARAGERGSGARDHGLCAAGRARLLCSVPQDGAQDGAVPAGIRQSCGN